MLLTFTRDLIDKVSGCVDRTLQLSRLQASSKASSITNGYLREAVRTYILGLPQASVALSRAALEQALKEKLALQLSGEFIKFQDLLKEARKWNILDGTMEMCARDVANAGDEVMHEKPTTLPRALEVLDQLRALLRHVYSVEVLTSFSAPQAAWRRTRSSSPASVKAFPCLSSTDACSRVHPLAAG